NGSGRSYIVFGRSDGSAPSLQDVSQGIGGFALDGQAGGDQSGSSVSGGGDLNGDGLSDIVIGASRADPNRSSSGRSYVVLGRIDGSPPSLEDVSNGIGGFALDGQTASERAGF